MSAPPILLQEMKFLARTPRGLVGQSSLMSVNATNSASFSSATRQNIRIDLPQQDYILMKESYLSLDLAVAAESGQTFSLKKAGIHSLISAVNIYVGGTLVETIQNYHMLSALLGDLKMSANKKATNFQEGWGGVALDATAKTFCFRLLGSGIMNIPQLLPLWKLGQVSVELVLNDSAECILATGGTVAGVYSVSNVKFFAEIHKMPTAYSEALEAQIASGGLKILYPAVSSSSFASGTATEAELQIRDTSRSVKSLFVVPRLDSNKADTDADYINPVNNMATAQLLIGSQQYPQTPLKAGAQSYVELLKAERGYSSHLDTPDSSITLANYTTTPTKFYVGFGLEDFLSQEVITGTDFQQSNGAVLKLQYSSAPTASTLYCYIVADALLEIRPDYQIQITK